MLPLALDTGSVGAERRGDADRRAYLAAVQRKDGAAAARLTADGSLVVSGMGAMKVDSPTIERMIAEHDASRRYELDESSVQTVDIGSDAAIISYKLRTTMPDGTSTEAFDTDVWVRRDGRWQCALHTEIPVASDQR